MASVIAATLSTGDHVGQPGFVRWKQVLAFAGYSFSFGVGCGLTWGLMAATGGGLWTYLLGAATLLCLAATAVALPFAGFLYVWGRLFPTSPLIDNTFEVLSELGKGLDAAADFVESTADNSQRAHEPTPGDTASPTERSRQAGERNPDLPGFALPQQTTYPDPELVVFKPSRFGFAYGGPGMFLTAIFLSFLVQALFGGAWGLAGGMFVGVLVFSVMWVPFVIYTAGTRILLTAHELSRSSLFGWRVRRVARSEVAGVRVTTRRLNMGTRDWPMYGNFANYSVVLKSGCRWALLRTPVFWKAEVGEGLGARLGRLR